MASNEVTQEQLSRIAETVQSDLQLADEQLVTINRYVKRAVNRILVFCFRRDLPEPLDKVGTVVDDQGPRLGHAEIELVQGVQQGGVLLPIP